MRWITVAPILPTYRNAGGLGEPHDLGEGISIGPPEFWPLDATVHQTLGDNYSTDVRDSTLWLVAQYNADAMREPSEIPGISKQDLALQRLREAILALWIVNPSALCFRVAIHENEREGEWRHHGYDLTCLYFRTLTRYRSARIVEAHVMAAREVFVGLVSLPHDGAVWIATRGLFNALLNADPPMRFLLLWIGLEALYGKLDTGRGGIGPSIARRAAAFLEMWPDEPANGIRKALEKSSHYRNQVVHGMRIAELPEPDELLWPLEGALRSSLHKILTDPAMIGVFNGDDREKMLDEEVKRSKNAGEARSGKTTH